MFKIFLVIIVGAVIQTLLDYLVGWMYSNPLSLLYMFHNVLFGLYGAIICLAVLSYMGIITF
jgi:hypothetical protein